MPSLIVAADAEGPILACSEGLSLWGGVDPDSGVVIDAHHPNHGASLAGRVVLMPTSRGSCSGSSVLVHLALHGTAPAALVFREAEGILTLGALVAARMFDRPIAVLRLPAPDYDRLAAQDRARLTGTRLEAGGHVWDLHPVSQADVTLTEGDRARLAGAEGPAVARAQDILCAMAAAQGATGLTDATRAHIDACIYAHDTNLTFAEAMADLGAKVAIPTTTNAISVDRENWPAQGVPRPFGEPASRLADAYLRMGARPNFTCAPYQDDDPPALGEVIGWSESNAVIYANSVLGARTAKHPDFMDLFVAITGRAPLSGVYRSENRVARAVIAVETPEAPDDAFWPLLGWLAGQRSPDRIPLLTGLEQVAPDADDLRALCAAFGTTSAAPMLHVAGITPESDLPAAPDAREARITLADLRRVWAQFNMGPRAVDLVALGSPHLSLAELGRFADLIDGRPRAAGTEVIVTLGRDMLARACATGLAARVTEAGVRLIPDLCWCSITEPVFPPAARTLMTNSGKYAHYAPGLSARQVRFGGLAACAEAAVTGVAPELPPAWLR